MADGRKNNGGHKTAGRKPKVDEIKLIETMDAIATPSDAWERLWKVCETGDVAALKTWIAYRFGQPKQSIDHTTNGENVQTLHLTPEVLSMLMANGPKD